MICGPSSTICAIATAPKKLANVLTTNISGCIKAINPEIKNIIDDVFAVETSSCKKKFFIKLTFLSSLQIVYKYELYPYLIRVYKKNSERVGDYLNLK